jgi:hypothetical protein
MRRTAILPVLVLALAVAGCNSGSTTKRTITVVNTITGRSIAVSAPKTPASVVVVSPSGPTKPTSSSKPTPTKKSTVPTTTKQTAAPIVKIDPLKADCPTLLAASDVKTAIGAAIGGNNNRIRLGPADRGVTGAVRCLYGSKDGGKSAPVRIRLTQYTSAAAAKKQVGVDVQAAQDGGATITTPTVNGYPATLQLIAGGVIEMQYGTLTMSFAVSDKLASKAKLTTGLPELASQVLTRLIKNG